MGTLLGDYIHGWSATSPECPGSYASLPVFFHFSSGRMRIRLCFNKCLLGSASPPPPTRIKLFIFLAVTRVLLSFCCSMCRALLLCLAHSRRAGGTLPRLFQGICSGRAASPGALSGCMLFTGGGKVLKCQRLKESRRKQGEHQLFSTSQRCLHAHSLGKWWVMSC